MTQAVAITGARPGARGDARWWATNAGEVATRAELDPVDYAAVVLAPLHAGAHPGEAMAWGLDGTARGVLTGLVAAGVLIDDDPLHLAALEWRAPIVCGVDGLLIEVHDVTVTAPRAAHLTHLLIPVDTATLAALSDGIGNPNPSALANRAAALVANLAGE